MAGFRPDEGKVLSGNILLKSITTDRPVDLEIGLFTNAAATETLTELAVTEPAGAGYARKSLTDANWTELAEVFSYAVQTFTPVGGNWAGVQGYFIATKSGGGTQRLIAVEIDPNGPFTILDGNDYAITPNITML